MEPVVGSGTQPALRLLGASQIPLLREFIVRRMAANVK
jgi:hypothetical protein